LFVKSPNQAVVIGRCARAVSTWALGLGQYLGHQIVAGIVLIVLLQQRQHLAGNLLVVQRLLAEATVAVVAGAGKQSALSAQHFVVQCVALEVADHPAIKVELMQVGRVKVSR